MRFLIFIFFITVILSDEALAEWPKTIQAERLASSKKATVNIHGKKSEKLKVIFFWASWCQYCRELANELMRIESKNPDLYHFIGLATDKEKKDAVRPAKNEYRFIKEMYWIATEEQKRLDIYKLPTVAIITREGKIDTIYEGSESDKINYLKKRLSYFEKGSSPDMDRM